MASVQGRAAGFIATLYYGSTVDVDKDLTSMGTGTASSYKIIDVADIGSLNKTRSVIDVPVYGNDTKGKLAGQADPGSFDFNVTLNMDDAIHASLRDDAGIVPHTFIIKFTQGSSVTYAAFDGVVADASVNTPIDDRIQMDISIARSGGVTWIDAT